MATKPKPKDKPDRFKVKTAKTTLHTARAPRDDLAIGNLTLNDKKLEMHLSELISSLTLDQTMDGASTLKLVIFDPDRRVLLSPLAATASTVVFDRVSYTLVGVEVQDITLTFTFEETAVNVLRKMRGPLKANRYNTTRAQFIRALVRQPKDYQIPFTSPEVNVKQPIAGGKIDVLKEASWLMPSGGVRRSRTAGQDASGAQGGPGQGWIVVGATMFDGAPGSCGTLGDGRPQYAELGQAGANAGMGGLLGPLFGLHGPLPCGYALDVEYNGKVVTAYKGDIGSGQLGESHFKIDMHTGLYQALGFSAGRGDVRIRKH
jgi:hypothetical protein